MCIRDSITPAVDGTLRALKAAKKSGIKRVVLTSSMVSMLEDADKSINIDHNSWSNEKAKNISAYAKSKTLAERSAWDFIKNQNEENPLELSVVNPGPVFGPTLSGNLEGAPSKLPESVGPNTCLLYTSPSPRDATLSRMPSSA